MAYEIEDFQSEVMDASRQIPVLVDFWAPWCGPCRALGPVLEKLAAENTGKWKLAKVNTDNNPEVSAQFGIRGIPAVKLIVDGAVVNEFTGALPEPQIRKWLNEALPSDDAKQLIQAEQALQSGDREGGEKLLRALIASDPENVEAKVLLARVIALENLTEAGQLLDGVSVHEADTREIVDSISTLSRLVGMLDAGDTFPAEQGAENYKAATQAVAQGNWDVALDRFIKVINENRYYDEDGSRKAVISIFRLLGFDHPLTLKHRRPFDMALY